MLRYWFVERFVASILDAQGTHQVELRVRTRSPRFTATSTLRVKSRARSDSPFQTMVTLQLRASTVSGWPHDAVQTKVTPSLHELSFTVPSGSSWSTRTVHVERAHGERRILTHTFVAGRSMTTSAPPRAIHLALSTLVASVLLVLGSLFVASATPDQRGNASVIPDSARTTEQAPQTSTPTTRVPVASTQPVMTVADPALALPVLTDKVEIDLLAGIPDDGRSYLVIPRLHLRMPIVKGVSDRQLAKGVGWYRASAVPGTKGNVGIAGHRTTAPAPFYFLDRLRVSDSILLVHADIIDRYEVMPDMNGKPSFNVSPSDVSVLGYIGYDSVTLTTCTPIGTTNERLIVHGRLRATRTFIRGGPND